MTTEAARDLCDGCGHADGVTVYKLCRPCVTAMAAKLGAVKRALSGAVDWDEFRKKALIYDSYGRPVAEIMSVQTSSVTSSPGYLSSSVPYNVTVINGLSQLVSATPPEADESEWIMRVKTLPTTKRAEDGTLRRALRRLRI